MIIHRAFRRESRLLAELAARVCAGDSARTAFLAGLPLPARVLWYSVGRIVYAAHVRRTRGGHRPDADAADQASTVHGAAPATGSAR